MNNDVIVVRCDRTGELKSIDMLTGEDVTVRLPETANHIYRFNLDVARAICTEIRKGRSLKRICEGDDFPPLEVIAHWQRTDTMFREELKLARIDRAEYHADMVQDIACDAMTGAFQTKEEIASAKLATDSFKWLAEKYNPKQYGAKVQNETTIDKQVTMRVVRTGISRKPKDVEVSFVKQEIEDDIKESADENSKDQNIDREQQPDENSGEGISDNGISGQQARPIRSKIKIRNFRQQEES